MTDTQTKKWLALSVAFSIGVLIIVLYFTIDESTIEYLSRLDPIFLILALGFHIFSICIWALRIKMMSRSLGYKVSFSHCFNLVLANMLVAAVTPSQAGGEPVRVHELYRADVKVGDATAIVLMERVLDGAVLGVIGAVAILLLTTYFGDLELNIAIPVAISWLLITGFVLMFIYSVRNPDFLKRLLHRLSNWVAKRWKSKKIERFTETIDSEVDNFHGSLTHFIGHGKSGLIWGTVLTVIYWFSEFFIASLILMGLGEQPFLIQSFIIQIVIAIIMMIPLTPGSSGVAELSAASLYGLFIPSSIVGIFVVLWRFILYYVNIILGVIASIYIVRREIILRKFRLK
jgi:uncharacterized protein (TIRG00374 family)